MSLAATTMIPAACRGQLQHAQQHANLWHCSRRAGQRWQAGQPLAMPRRYFAVPPAAPSVATDGDDSPRKGNRSMMHFRTTTQGHPLNIRKRCAEAFTSPGGDAAWDNPTLNHVWSKEELDARLCEQPKHVPTSALDKVIWASVRGCYHAFNFVTRFNKNDPSVSTQAIPPQPDLQWRV